MKKKKINILFSVLRGLASYACFTLIQIRTIIAFDTKIKRQGFYGVYGEVSTTQATVYRVIAIFLIMFFVIYSFALWNKKEKLSYLALEKREFSALDEVKSIVKSADFLAEVGVYVLFTVVSSALYVFAGAGLIWDKQLAEIPGSAYFKEIVLNESARNIYCTIDKTNFTLMNRFQNIDVWFSAENPSSMDELNLLRSVLDLCTYWFSSL